MDRYPPLATEVIRQHHRMHRVRYVRAGACMFLVASLVGCATPRPPAQTGVVLAGDPVPTAVTRDPDATGTRSTLFLIGDAGAPHNAGEPVLRALSLELQRLSTPATVVFLGDNVYPAGIPTASSLSRPEAERRLRAQLEAVGAFGHAVFLAGNHDWGAREDGVPALLRQDSLLRRWSDGRAHLSPRPGCPGPELLELPGNVKLLLLDTEWWVRGAEAPDTSLGCPTTDPPLVLRSLGALIDDGDASRMIVLGHHPLRSGGRHGGHATLLEHLFPLRERNAALWVPLPIVGSAYHTLRRLGAPGLASAQDLRSPDYQQFRRALDSTFRTHAPVLLYAAGHEHSLQVMPPASGLPWLVVSGAGIEGEATPVRRPADGCLALQQSGWIRIDVQSKAPMTLSVETVDHLGTVSKRMRMTLALRGTCPAP